MGNFRFLPMAVYVFGSNIMGQCGLAEDHCSTPVPVSLGLDGDRVECGYLHALLLSAGEVVTWGVNDEGALGRPGSEQPTAVQVGEKVADISAGGSVSAAVSVTGNLYVWGTFRGRHGVFGLTPECRISQKPLRVLGDVVRVSCGKNFVAAITAKGDLVTFGVGENNELGYRASTRLKRCLVPRQISNRYRREEKFCAVFSGDRSGMAINRSGHLFSWRGGLHRVCADVRDAAVGTAHEHVITAEGLYGRGENRDGQLGLGHRESTAEWEKVALPGVEKVRTKMDFSLAQKGSALFSWGPSTFGETGFNTGSTVPQRIPFDFGQIVDFSVGSDFSVVIGKKTGQG